MSFPSECAGRRIAGLLFNVAPASFSLAKELVETGVDRPARPANTTPGRGWHKLRQRLGDSRRKRRHCPKRWADRWKRASTPPRWH